MMEMCRYISEAVHVSSAGAPPPQYARVRIWAGVVASAAVKRLGLP
jgi:hypothetical protein